MQVTKNIFFSFVGKSLCIPEKEPCKGKCKEGFQFCNVGLELDICLSIEECQRITQRTPDLEDDYTTTALKTATENIFETECSNLELPCKGKVIEN